VCALQHAERRALERRRVAAASLTKRSIIAMRWNGPFRRSLAGASPEVQPFAGTLFQFTR